jgi:EAL domain-containing protein (putative c-di-GMP-specific phosphodiesterase class I)
MICSAMRRGSCAYTGEPETTLLEDQDSYLKLIRQLKSIGISMALDDFGTGYFSLN